MKYDVTVNVEMTIEIIRTVEADSEDDAHDAALDELDQLSPEDIAEDGMCLDIDYRVVNVA